MSIYKPSKRNRHILRLHGMGYKTKAIGEKFGISQITVRQIIRDLQNA